MHTGFANCFTLTYGLENPTSGTSKHQDYLIWAGRIQHNNDKPDSATLGTAETDQSIPVSPNQLQPSVSYDIGRQKSGVSYIEFGISREDTRTDATNNITVGLNILKWGFNRQSATDGSFSSNSTFYSTVQFVEAVARSMLELNAYSTVITGDSKPTYTDFKAKIKSAAEWIYSQISANATDLANDTRKSWGLAAALGETAQLIGAGDSDYSNFSSTAQTYATQALSAQWADGSNPLNSQEPDPTTQVEGIVYAEEYLLNANTISSSQSNSIKSMVQAGLEWETQWIDINGQIGFADPNRLVVNAFNLCVSNGIASTTKTTSFTTTATRVSDPRRM